MNFCDIFKCGLLFIGFNWKNEGGRVERKGCARAKTTEIVLFRDSRPVRGLPMKMRLGFSPTVCLSVRLSRVIYIEKHLFSGSFIFSSLTLRGTSFKFQIYNPQATWERLVPFKSSHTNRIYLTFLFLSMTDSILHNNKIINYIKYTYIIGIQIIFKSYCLSVSHKPKNYIFYK